MPAAVLGPVIGAAIGVGGTVAATKMGNNANRKAAETQVGGANYAADRQLEASREALAFQQQQAALAARQAEVDRRANYDQWAARERRLGSVSEMLGFGGRQIPDYVPGASGEFGAPMPNGLDRAASPMTGGSQAAAARTSMAQRAPDGSIASYFGPAQTLLMPPPDPSGSVGAYIRRR